MLLMRDGDDQASDLESVWGDLADSPGRVCEDWARGPGRLETSPFLSTSSGSDLPWSEPNDDGNVSSIKQGASAWFGRRSPSLWLGACWRNETIAGASVLPLPGLGHRLASRSGIGATTSTPTTNITVVDETQL